MPASVASCSLFRKVTCRPTDLDWVPRVDRASVTLAMAASTAPVVAAPAAMDWLVMVVMAVSAAMPPATVKPMAVVPPLTSLIRLVAVAPVHRLTPSKPAPARAEVISAPRARKSVR